MDTAYDKGHAKGPEEGHAKGLEEGEAKGRAEANRDMAIRLRDMGMSWEDISKVTGVKKEELE